MKRNYNPKLELSDSERGQLRSNKIKPAEIFQFAAEELEALLGVSKLRAKEIYALADFQRIPSIGIEFAKDLVFLGYYTIAELEGKDGAKLTDQYEKKKGFKTDVCVEDQFRLAVDFAKNFDYSKRWWDFTDEQKKYRAEHGYPIDRPVINWTEAQ